MSTTMIAPPEQREAPLPSRRRYERGVTLTGGSCDLCLRPVARPARIVFGHAEGPFEAEFYHAGCWERAVRDG